MSYTSPHLYWPVFDLILACAVECRLLFPSGQHHSRTTDFYNPDDKSFLVEGIYHLLAWQPGSAL